MARQRKNTTPEPRQGFYDERKIEWRELAPDVYEAANLVEPDYAMVAHAHYLGGDRKWMFKAMNGALVNNAAKGNTLVERQYSGVGNAPIIVNAFNAQQLAIQWLNDRHAEQKAHSDYLSEQIAAAGNVTNEWGEVMADVMLKQAVAPVAPVAEIHEVGGITNISIPPPEPKIVVAVDHAANGDQSAIVAIDSNGLPTLLKQGELTGKELLDYAFPRAVDPFTGKMIPADDVLAAQTVPNPAALEEKASDDSDDVVDAPEPVKKGRRRK